MTFLVALVFPFRPAHRGSSSRRRPTADKLLQLHVRAVCSRRAADAGHPIWLPSGRIPIEYVGLKGYVVGLAVLSDFARLSHLADIQDIETDFLISMWQQSHSRFLCRCSVERVIPLEIPVLSVAEDGHAPKNDVFRLLPAFAERLLAALPGDVQADLRRYRLAWAWQVAGPLVFLILSNLWSSLVHPIPSARATSRSLFTGINDAPQCDLSPAVADIDLLDASRLREIFFALGRYRSSLGPNEGDVQRVVVDGLLSHVQSLTHHMDTVMSRGVRKQVDDAHRVERFVALVSDASSLKCTSQRRPSDRLKILVTSPPHGHH